MLETEISIGDRSDGLLLNCEGRFCKARKLKPADLGCAIVDVRSEAIRKAIMRHLEEVCKPGSVPVITVQGVSISAQRQFDTRTRQYIATDIYLAWSNKIEKASPVPLFEIVNAFDRLVCKATMLIELQHLAPAETDIPCPHFNVLQLQ
eukprot:TRINITY_DN11068_c0_g1_i1.p1 TRINITY_DN11068_c0_g1~~TRINITY_DN11068_c0_g1_i1.p1  ORF type:complete len:149 (-),score=6.34 TRINITY_DN11068_c0_g1_i1:258-704(-)